MLPEFVRLLKVAAAGWWDDRAMSLGAAIAFFTTFLIWKAETPASQGIVDFMRSRLTSFAFILGIGFILLVSLVVDAGVSSLGNYLEAEFSGAALILSVMNNLVSFGVATLFFGMIFKGLPAVDLTWRDVAIGAVVTAALFTIGKFLIGFYLGQTNVASGFGAASSIITILLWSITRPSSFFSALSSRRRLPARMAAR